MNADAITKQIMDEIRPEFFTAHYGSEDRIQYAISRAVGSIISGLAPPDEAENKDRYECSICKGRCKGHTTDEPTRGAQVNPRNYDDPTTWATGEHGRVVDGPSERPCCGSCPIEKYESRISELESLLRTRTKQVKLALMVEDARRAFERSCKEHPL